MDEKIISVIIPAYNVGRDLRQCLDSVVNQTYVGFEAIIVIGDSDDQTNSICYEYAKNDDRFRIIRQKHKGVSAARNEGVEVSTGRYIAFLDADDYIEKEYFEFLLDAAITFNSDYVVCGYQKFLDSENVVYYHRNAKCWDVTFGNEHHIFQYAPYAKLISRELLVNYNIRFSEGEEYEDGPFSMLACLQSQNPVAIDYEGYYYRMRLDSLSAKNRKKGAVPNYPYNELERIACLKMKTTEHDYIRQYCIIKALAGFLTAVGRYMSSESRKKTCEYCYRVIDEYFENIGSNPYISKQPSKLPVSHRICVKLFVMSYKWRVLYLFSTISSAILRMLIGTGKIRRKIYKFI